MTVRLSDGPKEIPVHRCIPRADLSRVLPYALQQLGWNRLTADVPIDHALVASVSKFDDDVVHNRGKSPVLDKSVVEITRFLKIMTLSDRHDRMLPDGTRDRGQRSFWSGREPQKCSSCRMRILPTKSVVGSYAKTGSNKKGGARDTNSKNPLGSSIAFQLRLSSTCGRGAPQGDLEN
jgi:hypothetical protein